MNRKTISVIIPCYNGWQYMSKCLESLEKQTMLPDEIVIVDDCSLDDSYFQLCQYAKNSKLNIKVFKNETNIGPGETRNQAKKHITCDYVTFCDCDDWYELDFIKKLSKNIENNNPDLVIFDNFHVFGERKIVAGVTKNIKNATNKEILALYQMSVCRLCVSKYIAKEILFPRIYHGEDMVFAVKAISMAQKITVIDEPFYNYNHRDGSASLSSSPKVYKGLIEAFGAVKNLCRKNPQEIEFIGIKTVCYGATLNAFKAKLSNKVIEEFMREFETQYPKWHKNSYIKFLSRPKRLYVKLIKLRFYFFTRVFAKLHEKRTRA